MNLELLLGKRGFQSMNCRKLIMLI